MALFWVRSSFSTAEEECVRSCWHKSCFVAVSQLMRQLCQMFVWLNSRNVSSLVYQHFILLLSVATHTFIFVCFPPVEKMAEVDVIFKSCGSSMSSLICFSHSYSLQLFHIPSSIKAIFSLILRVPIKQVNVQKKQLYGNSAEAYVSHEQTPAFCLWTGICH